MKGRIIKPFKLPLILILLFALAGCSAKEPPPKEASLVIPVRVSKIELKDLYDNLEYVGNIKAQDEAMVFPKVSGKIIEKVKEDGAAVNKGDVLLYIDRDEVGLKFEKAPVLSPIAGVVGRIYVDKGGSVLPQTAVALVVNMDTVRIDLDIPEKYLPKISIGQEAQITSDAYPGQKFIGKVTKVSPVLDLATRSAPIEITIDNAGHLLKSGMFSKVSLAIDQRLNVPVILKEAIIGKEPDTYVYTVENNKAKTRKISLGIHEGPLYEVAQGLKEGEMVVIMGQQRLYDDAPVVVEEETRNQRTEARADE